jgi:hypothetical protein
MDNLIMGVNQYWVAEKHTFMTFEELRATCKQWLKHNLETEGKMPGNKIIPQALKHLPWCYEPVEWK